MSTFKEWLENEDPVGVPTLNRPPSFAAPEADIHNLDILYITGMGSKGEGPLKLENLGFKNVIWMQTGTDWGAALAGFWPTADVVKTASSLAGKTPKEWGPAHMKKNANRIRSELPPNYQPDIVIGSSQGGAVAIEMAGDFPKAKFILIAPAWKVFGIKPENISLPPGTIVIHGRRDLRVLHKHSKELKDIQPDIKLWTQEKEGHRPRLDQSLIQALEKHWQSLYPMKEWSEDNPLIEALREIITLELASKNG
jgi:hypothetical protein